MGLGGLSITEILPLIIIGLIGGLAFSYLPISKLSRAMCASLGLVGSIAAVIIFSSMLSSQAGVLIAAAFGSFGLPFLINAIKK